MLEEGSFYGPHNVETQAKMKGVLCDPQSAGVTYEDNTIQRQPKMKDRNIQPVHKRKIAPGSRPSNLRLLNQ